MLNKHLDFEKEIGELDALIAELKHLSTDPSVRADAATKQIDIEARIAEIEALRQEKLCQIFSNLTPWQKVQMARHVERPYTLDYLRILFQDFLELHGDRINADDAAIVGGLAKFGGQSVVVIGHQKARDLKERQLRNFGSARPAGFRKALRLMQMAQKFKKPIFVFVDTPAAEANLMAEEEGISRTIALCLQEMVLISVPIIVVVIGEGGSGGALGIAVGDKILMLEHAVYSVIPPEGCAAILWNDRTRAADASDALKLTAQHALEFGIIDEILPEPLGGAHRNVGEMAETLREAFTRTLAELQRYSADILLENRYQKFRNLGMWDDPALVLPETPKPRRTRTRKE